MKSEIAYANSKGIEVGGYDLIVLTRAVREDWRDIGGDGACIASNWCVCLCVCVCGLAIHFYQRCADADILASMSADLRPCLQEVVSIRDHNSHIWAALLKLRSNIQTSSQNALFHLLN